MKQNKYQSGSTHLIIIVVVIVVALIGALGYVFYDKYIAKKKVTNTTTATTATTAKNNINLDKTISIDPSTTSPITFSYPSTWTIYRPFEVDGDANSTSGGETIEIESPSSNISVEIDYTIQQSGFGYECSPYDPEITSYTFEGLKDYPGMSYYEFIAVDSHDDTLNNKFLFMSYLNKTNNTNKTNFCGAADIQNVVSRLYTEEDINNSNIYALWTARILRFDESGEYNYANIAETEDEINSIRESDDYKTAKAILLSASVE